MTPIIVIWRGWGPLAIVAIFPLLASCAGLLDLEARWVWVAAVELSLLVAGAVCIYFGTKWNWYGVQHDLFFIPLQFYGWVYISFAGLANLAGIGGAIKQGLGQPRWLYQYAAGVVGLIVTVGLAVLLPRLARPKSRR